MNSNNPYQSPNFNDVPKTDWVAYIFTVIYIIFMVTPIIIYCFIIYIITESSEMRLSDVLTMMLIPSLIIPMLVCYIREIKKLWRTN